jgi:Leucine-rich repeat (LRR) protein
MAINKNGEPFLVGLRGKNLDSVDLRTMYNEFDFRSITDLDLAFNRLVELPELPPNLKRLFCNHNRLRTLPLLPPKLISLRCNNNNLVELAPLPNSLLSIDCNNNQLTVLPALPNKLRMLICSNNPITRLPKLPETLEVLEIMFTHITVLPFLPEKLMDLRIYDSLGRTTIFLQEPYHSILINNRGNIPLIIRQVNTYNKSLESGRNLASMMQTIGRGELKGRNGTQADASMNRLNTGPLSVIGSYLTGVGNRNLKTQRLLLREAASRPPGGSGVGGSKRRLKKLTRKFRK